MSQLANWPLNMDQQNSRWIRWARRPDEPSGGLSQSATRIATSISLLVKLEFHQVQKAAKWTEMAECRRPGRRNSAAWLQSDSKPRADQRIHSRAGRERF